jgi:glycosyltransferase involved in cell wall biosynthesis
MIALMNGCARAGIEVHVLVETNDNPDFEQLNRSVQPHVRDLGEGGGGVARMRAVLEELRPNAVMANKDRASALVVEAVAPMDPRPRVMIRVGTHQPAKLRHQSLLSRLRIRRSLRAVYPKADVLVGISQGVCDGLRELLGGLAPPIRCIYNPMDLAGIRVRSRAEPSHPWFREPRGRLLVSVGRLSRIKDQETMLRALALLPEDVRLVIFGEGKQRPRLEALAQKLGLGARVDLPGYTPNPFAHVARADLFVLSSRFEGFCNALLEALVVGTPAVSTDCPSGPREILDGGRFGRLVPIGQPQLLAEAIVRTLEDPPPSAMLAEAVARLHTEQAVPGYLDALGLSGTGDSQCG